MCFGGATAVLFFIAICNTNLLILAPEEPAEAGEGPFPFVFAPILLTLTHSPSVNM